MTAKETVRRHALGLGFDDCRFASSALPEHRDHFNRWIDDGRHGEMEYLARNAPKRVDPQLVLPGANTLIALATNYHLPSLPAKSGAGPSGEIAAYARHLDYHDVLAGRLKTLAEFVDAQCGSQSLGYVDTGPILERDAAHRAGIGFTGKHTNVISRRFGNWILLSEILTTAKFDPDASETNRCGTCTRCLAACPTGAITAPFELDARLCISYLTIELKGPIPLALRPKIGTRIFGCDDCLAVCPWNRFAREAEAMRAFRRPDLDQPALLELLALDDAEFKARFKGTPIWRSKRRGLLRNVCVALGNLKDPSALPHLEKAASDPEPLIAEHARWAIDQIHGTSQ